MTASITTFYEKHTTNIMVLNTEGLIIKFFQAQL